MGIGSWLFGSSGGVQQATTKTPQQQQAIESMLSQLQGPQQQAIGALGSLVSQDPAAMRAFEEPAMRQFQQQIMPGIAERYAGLGTGGALGSSAFQQAQVQGGRELSENLAAMRANLQQQAIQKLMGMQGLGQTQMFENMFQQPSQGALSGLAGGALSGLASYGMMGGFSGGGSPVDGLPGGLGALPNAPMFSKGEGIMAAGQGGSSANILDNYLAATGRR